MTAPPSLQHGAVYSIYIVYAVDAECSTNMRQCTRVGHLTSQQQVGAAGGIRAGTSTGHAPREPRLGPWL